MHFSSDARAGPVLLCEWGIGIDQELLTGGSLFILRCELFVRLVDTSTDTHTHTHTPTHPHTHTHAVKDG